MNTLEYLANLMIMSVQIQFVATDEAIPFSTIAKQSAARMVAYTKQFLGNTTIPATIQMLTITDPKGWSEGVEQAVTYLVETDILISTDAGYILTDSAKETRAHAITTLQSVLGPNFDVKQALGVTPTTGNA